MYGMLIVEPKAGWAPAQEFALVQGEFYRDVNDMDGMLAAQPQFTVFNGRAFRYKETPLEAAPGQRLRSFMVNAGPSLFSAFHIVGTVFDIVTHSFADPTRGVLGLLKVTPEPHGPPDDYPAHVAATTCPDKQSHV